MNNIKVSVIIPCFNSSLTIKKSLNSVINQDFNDFEVILIDNHSTDNTVSIAEEILSNSNISYKISVNSENKGQSFSRNKGMDLAEGNYLIFVDSDDTIASNHISNLYNNITPTNQASFVKLVKVDEDFNYLYKSNEYNNLLSLKTEDNLISDDVFSIDSKELIKLELLMRIPFSFTQLIYNKEIIRENNIKFNESVSYGEDTDFALRYLACINNVSIVFEDTYFYYQHNKSTSHNINLGRFDFVSVLEDLAIFYDNLNYKDLKNLVITSRIPKSIFGNLMYLFHENYSFEEIISEIEKRDLFIKLIKFKKYDKKDSKFDTKLKHFIKYPKNYYKIWKLFKDSIK